LGINVDFFKEYRWDIFVEPSASVPSVMSVPTPLPRINFGEVENWGYEIALSWSDRIGSDFRYSISPNMSFSRNKVIEMMEIPQLFDHLYRTGHKVDQPFGFEFFGFYEPGVTEVAYFEKYQRDMPNHGFTLRPGDKVFVDICESGYITENSRWAVGFPDYPEFYFGLNTNFRYRRFELNMLWVGATNVSRRLSTGFNPAFGTEDDSALLDFVARNSWTEENPNSLFPRITFANRNNNERDSRVWIQDASYARLKNLEIAYNLNVDNLPFVSSMRLFASGHNLFTFTNYLANDPETTGGGMNTWFRYPPTRVYTIGFRANF